MPKKLDWVILCLLTLECFVVITVHFGSMLATLSEKKLERELTWNLLCAEIVDDNRIIRDFCGADDESLSKLTEVFKPMRLSSRPCEWIELALI